MRISSHGPEYYSINTLSVHLLIRSYSFCVHGRHLYVIRASEFVALSTLVIGACQGALRTFELRLTGPACVAVHQKRIRQFPVVGSDSYRHIGTSSRKSRTFETIWMIKRQWCSLQVLPLVAASGPRPHAILFPPHDRLLGQASALLEVKKSSLTKG